MCMTMIHYKQLMCFYHTMPLFHTGQQKFLDGVVNKGWKNRYFYTCVKQRS